MCDPDSVRLLEDVLAEEASDRLSENKYDEDSVEVYAPQQYFYDLKDVAKAFARLVDATPLTIEIIERSGWKKDSGGVWAHPATSYWYLDWLGEIGGFEISVYDDRGPFGIGEITTVGQLRCLLKAFGFQIEVKAK